MARRTLLDRAIAYFSPRTALARHFDGMRLQRAYDAASPRDRWKPRRGGASANADHQADAAKLREKARALVQNVPYCTAALSALVSHTVGTGIVPRATGKNAEKVNALFTAWAPVCDADGRLDFNGIIAGAYRAMEQDGEVLIRLRPRRAEDNLPVPLQLQLLEIDWLDTTRTQAVGSNRIVNGIEYDYLGAVVAYWLWSNHPGDVNTFTGLRTQSTRIDARYIIHLFAPERPGQGRGFTRFASVIGRVRDLQLYEDAELARKNLETRLGVVYSGDASAMANPAVDGQPADPTTIAKTGDLGDLPSGAMTQLPTGSQVSIIEPHVAAGYTDYVKQQLHIIASGIGVPYEMMVGDMLEVNFSSARVRRLDFRRTVEQMQTLLLYPKLLVPLWESFIDAGVLGGQLQTRDYAMDYSVPKWDYVNPEQDVKADIAEISVGLSSISEKLRQRGYRPEDVFAEIQKDFDRLKALGVLDILLFKEKAKLPDDPAAAADAKSQEEKRADRRHEEALLASREAAAQMREIVAAASARPIDVRVEAPKPADVVVNQAPVNVTVEAPKQPKAVQRTLEHDPVTGLIRSETERVLDE